MNLQIFNYPDPSGKMYKESFLIKNYKTEYDYIINYANNNNLLDIPFKEKVYLSINNLTVVPRCKNINCNKNVKFINSSLGYREYCSIKCISSDPKIIKLKEENSLKKFGTKSPSQSQDIKDKIIKTNLKRYGYNSPMCLSEIQEKSKKTLLKNHGVDNPCKSKDLLSKRVESFKLSNYKESYKKTSMDKYGVEHPWMNKEIHQKTINSFYNSYKLRIENKIDKVKFKFLKFQKGITTSLIFNCSTCNKDFEILPYQFYYRINNKISICTNCFPISENSSISQIELYNFIMNNYDGEVILNYKNKDIIGTYELDIYLPQLKIGFEFNGIWWHSNKFKDKNYHLNKTNLCESKDIHLIHIWEDDWIINREICESFILNKLLRTKIKIYARKCEVKEVSYKDSKIFLDNNHFQKDCKSSIRLGLFNNNKLVSLMTFSMLRLPLQRNKKIRDRKDHYELTRFCNVLNTNVVGGSSKLLKYFIKKYSPIQIDTYSDNLISDGSLYRKLGFKYSHTSNPGYWYVVDGIREHRFNWRKQKLIKLGYDDRKTEEEIMSELGYYRIYNAGNKKWIFIK